MTGRDRLVMTVFSSLAVLGAVWLLLVSPERKKATQAEAQVSAASAQLASAEAALVSVRAAQASYAAAYSTVVRLGKAVPAGEQVPSLIYELAQATHQKSVDFSSIAAGTSAGSSPSSATPVASEAGISALPFTFTFTGTFTSLYHLFNQLDRFAARTASGELQVHGRLLTVQSVKLGPGTTTGAAGTPGQLTGTISATAYALPATQGLTAGVAPSATGPSSSPVSTTSGPTSAPSPPAIVRASP